MQPDNQSDHSQEAHILKPGSPLAGVTANAPQSRAYHRRPDDMPTWGEHAAEPDVLEHGVRTVRDQDPERITRGLEDRKPGANRAAQQEAVQQPPSLHVPTQDQQGHQLARLLDDAGRRSPQPPQLQQLEPIE